MNTEDAAKKFVRLLVDGEAWRRVKEVVKQIGGNAELLRHWATFQHSSYGRKLFVGVADALDFPLFPDGFPTEKEESNADQTNPAG
jgi:hypothetical protein